MAVLVAVAGGLVGSIFGVPQLGFLIGSLLGSFLFQPSGPKAVGKVNDVRVTSSTYGSPITRGFGTARVGGNIIFGDALKEHKHKEGGKGGPSYTSYTYTWTGGVGIARGPIADVLRIWADSKLVFDKTGATSKKTLNQYKLNFRLYTGTETQLPDAALEAKVGVDNAVAHRGLAYIVFDDIPVKDYGNRVPNWTFEVVFDATTASNPATQMLAQGGSNSVIGSFGGSGSAVDWDNDRMFLIEGSSTRGIYTDSVLTGTTTNYTPGTSLGFNFGGTSARFYLGLDGYLYMQNNATNISPWYKIDPDAGTVVGTFGTSSYPFITNDQSAGPHTGFVFNGGAVPLQIAGTNLLFTIGVGGTLSLTDVGVFCTDSMSVIASDGYFSNGITDGYGHICGGVTVSDDEGTVFCIGSNTTLLSSVDVTKFVVNQYGQFSQTILRTLHATDIDASWVGINGGAPLYDLTDGNFICGVTCNNTVPTGVSQHYMLKIDSTTGDILWKTAVNSIPLSGDNNILSNGEYSWVGSGGEDYNGAGNGSASGFRAVYTINTATGDLTRDEWQMAQPPVQQNYNGDWSAIAFYGTVSPDVSNHWWVILANRASAGAVSVADVVTRLCADVGLASSDIDVADLSGLNVDGYVITQQQNAKDSIAPLALTFSFDGVESDDKIKFVKRGSASVVTIPATDLAIMDAKTNSVSQETRTQEVELPNQISVQFLDPNHDYQQATQYMRRPAAPVRTMYSANVQSLGLPIVMQPNDAKQLCELILYSAWTERIGYKLKTSWKYLKYDPSDMITVSFTDGSSVLTRFTETDVGADLTMDVNAVAESTETYNPVATAYGGDGFTAQQIVGSLSGKLWLLDVPLLRDVDDTGRSYMILYFAGGGYANGWPGMELYKSADAASFSDIGGVSSTASWGICRNTLADVSNPFTLDNTNSLTVSMVQGGSNLSSVTLLDVCNGANAAALYNKTTGTVEIIQFTTAVANADGSYTLSGLARGRRGTEVYTGSHGAGEAFILLSTATGAVASGIAEAGLALGELNSQRYYKGVVQGSLIEDAKPQTFTDTGRSLKPYAPVHTAAAVSGSDIHITWNRRTRVGGEMRDGTGTVPLNEDTESYEIDIYNAAGDTVLRTLTATSETATYLAADITTDFGSTPSTLTLAVYQISAQVGRGFGTKVTVTVG